MPMLTGGVCLCVYVRDNDLKRYEVIRLHIAAPVPVGDHALRYWINCIQTKYLFLSFYVSENIHNGPNIFEGACMWNYLTIICIALLKMSLEGPKHILKYISDQFF